MDPPEVKAPNIKVKSGEAVEEIDRGHNSPCQKELGPLGSGSEGLEDQRKDLHPEMDGLG